MERQPITVIYAGRRVSKADKPSHVWFLGDRELRYDKLKGTAIGGVYTVDSDQGDDDSLGATVYPSTLRYTGEQHDDVDQVALWQAADESARAEIALAAAERRHSKSSELDTTLEPLLELVRKARTRGDVVALERVVQARLEKAWWRS